MKLIRYIHPIGQGAFYTEQFFNENNEKIATVVYDCGSSSNKRSIEHEIKSMFSIPKDYKDIDILFISHLHEDHINGIAQLKDLTNIKNVVIPLYENDTQSLLLATIRPRDKDDNLEKLIQDPNSFFPSTTHVIRVNSLKGGLNTSGAPIVIEELNDTIESGTAITLKSLSQQNIFWEYIPYNQKYDERVKNLAKELDISQQDLLNNIGDEVFQKELKVKYKKITSKELINAHSMMVYSGLYQEEAKYDDNVPNGCLYTGDASFNNAITQKLSEHLGNRCSNIVMLQIPHHGSGRSFHSTFFNLLRNESTYPILFLSCGKNNTYGHPSSGVITNCNLFLNSHKCLPILHNSFQREQDVRIVCEDRCSMLVVVYEFNSNIKTISL